VVSRNLVRNRSFPTSVYSTIYHLCIIYTYLINQRSPIKSVFFTTIDVFLYGQQRVTSIIYFLSQTESEFQRDEAIEEDQQTNFDRFHC